MNPIERVVARCPCCGEPWDLVIDCSAGNQCYIEDCSVCCQPVTVTVTIDARGTLEVVVTSENEC